MKYGRVDICHVRVNMEGLYDDIPQSDDLTYDICDKACGDNVVSYYMASVITPYCHLLSFQIRTRYINQHNIKHLLSFNTLD